MGVGEAKDTCQEVVARRRLWYLPTSILKGRELHLRMSSKHQLLIRRNIPTSVITRLTVIVSKRLERPKKYVRVRHAILVIYLHTDNNTFFLLLSLILDIFSQARL